ncbi:MAG: hypothetical protein ACE5FK_04855, partial [Candidatus Methylomirabilia bacterium]
LGIDGMLAPEPWQMGAWVSLSPEVELVQELKRNLPGLTTLAHGSVLTSGAERPYCRLRFSGGPYPTAPRRSSATSSKNYSCWTRPRS